MRLNDIIKKSRILVDKLHNKDGAMLSEEDYFMLSVSLFIARKESIIRKDSSTNTLYFDYTEYIHDYIKYQMVVEQLSQNATIKALIPSLGEFDLTKEGCFDGIEDLKFPLDTKVEIKNFNGTQNELNEVKRVIWIISKLRDCFVHGEKFEFDFEGKKITMNNSMNATSMGGFDIILSIEPELLAFLCESDVINDNKQNNFYNKVFYSNKNKDFFIDQDKLGRLNDIYNNKYSQKYADYLRNYNTKKEKSIDEIICLIKEELKNIGDEYILRSIDELLKEYNKLNNKMTIEQQIYFLDRFLKLIKLFTKNIKLNDNKSRKLIKLLSELLMSENEYYAVLYSHMIFVFSNIERINTKNLRLSNFEIDDDVFKEAIKNRIKKIVEILNKLRDSNQKLYLDSNVYREYFIYEMNKILELLEKRNKWLLNKIRNGIEHKNIIFISDEKIEIFDRKNNNEEGKEFSCRIDVKNMDNFLRQVESMEESFDDLSIDEFISEVENIVGPMKSLEIFKTYLRSIQVFLENKDNPPNL